MILTKAKLNQASAHARRTRARQAGVSRALFREETYPVVTVYVRTNRTCVKSGSRDESMFVMSDSAISNSSASGTTDRCSARASIIIASESALDTMKAHASITSITSSSAAAVAVVCAMAIELLTINSISLSILFIAHISGWRTCKCA